MANVGDVGDGGQHGVHCPAPAAGHLTNSSATLQLLQFIHHRYLKNKMKIHKKIFLILFSS